jgi:TolA-binding protein
MPTVRFRLGLTQFANKDYMAAATSFTATLEDSAAADVRAAARYNLALCHRMMNRSEEARVELETYRKEFPGDARAADVAFQLGDLDEAAGKVKEAAAGFEEALASRPRKELKTEAGFRLGRLRERLGDADGALAAYKGAVEAGERDDAYRLSAVARCAAMYESRREYTRAVAAYRDIIKNAGDQELVAVATDRVSQLEKKTGKR